jgi:hypothetical protein
MVTLSSAQTPIQVKSPLNGRPLYKVFIRQQSTTQTFTPGSNFNYVTGTNAVFHVTKNTLFKITYQGNAENHRNNYLAIALQMIVNDRIISGASLKQNSGGDGAGGYYWSMQQSDHSLFVSRMTMVYLRPGTYSFHLGVKTTYPNLELHSAMVHYELTQFDDQDQEDSLGDLQLASV